METRTRQEASKTLVFFKLVVFWHSNCNAILRILQCFHNKNTKRQQLPYVGTSMDNMQDWSRKSILGKSHLSSLTSDKLGSSTLKDNSSIHAVALLAFLKFQLSCLFNRSRQWRRIGTALIHDICHFCSTCKTLELIFVPQKKLRKSRQNLFCVKIA